MTTLSKRLAALWLPKWLSKAVHYKTSQSYRHQLTFTESSKKAKDDTPLVMRAHPVPWMKPEYITPELSGQAAKKKEEVPPLTAEEKKQFMAPKHMSASYTSFVLPLASNPRLYDKYVNFAGGFREFIRATVFQADI